MRKGGKLGPITMTATPVDRRPTASVGASKAWFRITNVAATATNEASTRVDIYEEIGGWGVSAAEFVEALRAVNTPSIDLHINSPGGSVFDGVAIYNALSQHPAQVHGYVDGLAASAASFIAQACDTITMNPGSMMMVHDAIGMTWGNASDHTTMAGLLAQVSDSIADLYAARAGGTGAEWRAVMENNGGEGRWYTAREAVAAGLADKVAGDPEPGDSVADPAPESTDPREAYDNSSVAAGHRLVQHYRDQVLATAPPPVQRVAPMPAPRPADLEAAADLGAAVAAWHAGTRAMLLGDAPPAPIRPADLEATPVDPFAVFAASWAREATMPGPLADWPDKTASGTTPLVTW